MLIIKVQELSTKYNLSELQNYINVSLTISIFLTIFTIILLSLLYIIGERCYDSKSQKIRYCISWAISKISIEYKRKIFWSKIAFLILDFASIIIFSIAFTYIKSNNNFISQTLISFLSILVFKILTVVVVFASSSYAISITVWTIFHILVKRGIKLKAEELEMFD